MVRRTYTPELEGIKVIHVCLGTSTESVGKLHSYVRDKIAYDTALPQEEIKKQLINYITQLTKLFDYNCLSVPDNTVKHIFNTFDSILAIDTRETSSPLSYTVLGLVTNIAELTQGVTTSDYHSTIESIKKGLYLTNDICLMLSTSLKKVMYDHVNTLKTDEKERILKYESIETNVKNDKKLSSLVNGIDVDELKDKIDELSKSKEDSKGASS